jgi:hypothetical protein
VLKEPTLSVLPTSTSTTPETTFEELVRLRLDELDRKLERLLEMTCPVCGPALVAQIHPKVEEHGS